MRKLLLAATTLLSTTALLLQGVVPAFADVVVAAPFEAKDFLSARVEAVARHHRVLIGDELTADSTTWVNPDGTLTTESYGAPIRVTDPTGLFGWRDLNFDLVFTNDGFVEATSGLLPLRINGGGSVEEVARDGLVSVTNNSSTFGFGFDGALPKPVLNGDTARFVDVYEGVDLLIRLDATGFEQFFEVKTKPSVETLNKLQLLVTGTKISVVANSAGGYDFVSDKQAVASMVSPSVYDSSTGLETPTSEPLDPTLTAETTVSATGVSSQVLGLGVDPTFFDQPDLVYPVIVDPSVTLNSSFDSYISNAYPSSDFQSSTELLVGTPDGGASKYRALLNFPATAWAGQDIVSAYLKMYLHWSWSCTPKPFNVYPTDPVTSSIRWGNQPAINYSVTASKTVAAGYNTTCDSAYVNTNITNVIDYLSPTVGSTAGLELRASETDSFGWKRFNSANASTGKPTLTVTYNRAPLTPATPTVQNSVVVNNVLTVGQRKPSFTTTATDPDGNDVTVSFNSYSSATSTVSLGALCSVTVASGSVATCQTSNALVDQTTYFVRATANDLRVSSSYSSPVTFKVSTTQPVAPTISCPNWPNGYASGGVPTTDVTCTVSAPASTQAAKPSQVSYTLDDQTPLTLTVNADGSYSYPVTLKTGSFQHKITAVATSSTGIQSDPSVYTVSFGVAGVISPQKVQTVVKTVYVSSYAEYFNGTTPSSTQILWRKTGATSWNTYQTGVTVNLADGFYGLHQYPVDVTQIGVGVLPTNLPVQIDLEICYVYPSSSQNLCTSGGLSFIRMPTRFESAATSSAGPGQVSLTTGAFSLSETDFSQAVGFDQLFVSRDYVNDVASPNPQSGLFGPGWVSSITTDAASSSSLTLSFDLDSKNYVLMQGETAYVYKDTGTSFVAATEPTINAQLALSWVTPTLLKVTETDGSETLFQKISDTVWQVACAKNTANGRPVYSTYTTDGLVASIGYGTSGINCSSANVTTGLTFEYVNTAGGMRLNKVNYVGTDPVTNTQNTTLEVVYAYDNVGRLVSVTNQTNQHVLSYTYNGSTASNTQLARVSESGFAPYKLVYDSNNRLVQVQRVTTVLGVEFYSAENTYLYGLTPNGNTGLQPNLPASVTVHWGQTQAPAFMVGVMGSENNTLVADGATPTFTSTDPKWLQTSYTFLDADGYQVNTAVYGKTHWLFTAKLFNGDHTVAATYDQVGIENVLNRYASDGSDAFDEQQYAKVYKYLSAINNVAVVPNTYISDTWSPVHTVSDAYTNQTLVRTHTSYSYDAGSPNGFHGFVTSQTVGVTNGANISTVDATQLSQTLNFYDPQDGLSNTGATSGWVLGQPTKTQSLVGGVVVSETTTVYNKYGQVTKQTLPGATGVGPDGRTTLTTYYSADAQSPHPECGLHPLWVNLVCVTENLGSTLPSKYVSAYDIRFNPTVIQEVAGSTVLRTTTNTFLPDNRLDTTTLSGAGLTSLKTVNVYDPTSLLQTGAKLYVGGVYQNQTSQSFDVYGRQTSYVNAQNETTSTTYVDAGQLGAGSTKTITTPQTVTSYTYGDAANGENRGLVTGLQVTSNTSTAYTYAYTASYNEFGALVQQVGPDGIAQNFTFNDSQRVETMSYSIPQTGANNQLLTWARFYDAYGRVIVEKEPNVEDTSLINNRVNVYSYDPVSRLANVSTTTPTTSITDSYTYDASGNRLSKTTGLTGSGVTKTNSYNSFSQLTNSGYVYDQLGRNTVIPAVDTQNGTATISLTYNINDSVASISQNGVSQSYTYDVAGRRLNETTGTTTTVRHYTDGSDNPDWTSQAGTTPTTEVYTPSLGSGLNVTTTLTGSTRTSMLQLTDIRGDTVSTVDLDANTSTPWQTFDEFGNPTNTQTSSKLVNYGAYGQQQRETNDTGLILMGARVYNPVTNQFTSPDPVPGGNENAYTYPNDPINSYDFNGCNDWVNFGVFLVGAALGGAVCALTAIVGCVIGGAIIGAVGGFVESSVEANEQHLKGKKWVDKVAWGTFLGGAAGAAGGALGSVVKEGLVAGEFLKDYGKFTVGDLVQETAFGAAGERVARHKIQELANKIKYASRSIKVLLKRLKSSRD